MATGLPASTVATPSAAALATLQRRVLDWSVSPQADPDLALMATNAINGGINRLNSRNWQKLLNQHTISLVADSNWYSLNADFRDARHMELLNSSDYPDGRLVFQELKTFLTENPSATKSGRPLVYTTNPHTLKMFFNIAPNQDFVTKYPKVRLWYHFRHPHLVAPDDQIVYPDEMVEFVVWYAREEVSGIRAPGKFALARATRTELWRDLIASDTDTVTDWGPVSWVN